MAAKRAKLEIKTWSSPDIDLHDWAPRDRLDVKFLLELEIGTVGENQRDIFQVVVATPEGLRKHSRSEVICERATLVLSNYSWSLLQRTCTNIVRRCEASSWEEAVLRLQRYFEWEYEDFVEK
jgi:hypothetical protein